jgi:hypothetical protein
MCSMHLCKVTPDYIRKYDLQLVINPVVTYTVRPFCRRRSVRIRGLNMDG